MPPFLPLEVVRSLPSLYQPEGNPLFRIICKYAFYKVSIPEDVKKKSEQVYIKKNTESLKQHS